MNIPLARTLAFALTATFLQAAPLDDVAAAARKLAAVPNYSWTVTTEFANAPFPVVPAEGVTEKGGFTMVTTNFNNNTRQAVRKGEQVVTQNREGEWVTMEEWRQQFAGATGGGGAAAGGGTAVGGGGARGGGGRGGFGIFGGGAPMDFAQDVIDLVGKTKEAKVADGAVSGMLSPDDAAALLAFGRGGRGSAPGGATPPAARNATATVKFWLKDGGLVKYIVNVKGSVMGPNGDERDIDLTTTTEIKNVGSTKVTVPDAAKKKLGA